LKKIFIIIFALLAVFAYSQNAVISNFTGKVEVKFPSGSSWEPVSANMEIPIGSFISTGFNSSAVIDLGTSTIRVKSLTRMKIEDLASDQQSVSTDLFLNFGNISVDVEPQEDINHNFTLKSPISTAAVRGTSFEFDTVSVVVTNGSVTFSNQLGQQRTVNLGGSSRTSGKDLPADIKDMLSESSTVPSNTSPLGDRPGVILPGDLGPGATGTLTLTWSY
jgi:hypothetical protein